MFHDLVPAPGRDPDWADLRDRFAWLRALDACPQDPIHHAEGDVGTHTRRVVDALLADPAWAALDAAARAELFWAALLHDVAKPATTRMENGRVTAPGHAPRGARRAREILWRMGAPLNARERVCALVADHLQPFHAIDRTDPGRLARRISWRGGCAAQAMLADADLAGRVCADAPRLADQIALFRAAAEEADCAAAPYPFPNAHSRFLYFRRTDRAPDYAAHDDWADPVWLLSGLPAAGKDTWLSRAGDGREVISLDALRAELGVSPAGNQGAVIQEAKRLLRAALRAERPVAWNATNLTRALRDQLIELIAAYRAKIRMIYLEAAPDELRRRNRARPRPVPDQALARMIARWETPDRTEAHALDIIAGERPRR